VTLLVAGCGFQKKKAKGHGGICLQAGRPRATVSVTSDGHRGRARRAQGSRNIPFTRAPANGEGRPGPSPASMSTIRLLGPGHSSARTDRKIPETAIFPPVDADRGPGGPKADSVARLNSPSTGEGQPGPVGAQVRARTPAPNDLGSCGDVEQQAG